jgi:FKBP-type peptidyl-prolyl cis-trans isomerase 2
MANAWANTNWSQFFINQVDNSYLNGKHTVFGQVVEWMDNVNNIAWTKVDSNDKPVKEVKLIKVEVKKYSSGALKDIDFNLEDELKKIEGAKKDRVVKNWDKIKVNYTLKLEDWTEFDSSYKRWEPIEFEVWGWYMIKGFDEWVVWMKIWEKKTLKLTPAEAYGEYDKKNIQEVDRSQLKQLEDQWFEVKVWAKVPTAYWEFPITKVTSDKVSVDLNHQLAWKNLTFEVEMVSFSN